MNEILLATYKSDVSTIVVPEKAKDRELCASPEASLEKNGARFIWKGADSTIHDGDAKDVGRGRQVIGFVTRVGSHGKKGAVEKAEQVATTYIYTSSGFHSLQIASRKF